MDLIEQADILDKAADVMLVRGRCTTGHLEEDLDGRVCLVGAVAVAMGHSPFTDRDIDFYEVPPVRALQSSLQEESPYRVGVWNDEHPGPEGDDEAFDLLRNTAKHLREVAQS